MSHRFIFVLVVYTLTAALTPVLSAFAQDTQPSQALVDYRSFIFGCVPEKVAVI